MTTNVAAVQEVFLVERDRSKERAEAENKFKSERSQAAYDRAKKIVIFLLPFLWGKFAKKKISKYCNYPVFLLLDTAIVHYL